MFSQMKSLYSHHIHWKWNGHPRYYSVEFLAHSTSTPTRITGTSRISSYPVDSKRRRLKVVLGFFQVPLPTIPS